MGSKSLGVLARVIVLAVIPFGCSELDSGGPQQVGTGTSGLAVWAHGNFSQVLRVNPGETTVRNICELTVPLASMKPLTFTASGSPAAGSPTSLGWSGNAVSALGVEVSACGNYPCEVTARWRGTAPNGSALGCQIVADDGVSRLVGTSSGTRLTIAAPPTAPVIANQDVKIGPQGSAIAASCVLRQSALLSEAAVTGFEVFVDGVSEVALVGPTAIGNVPWPTPGPAVPLGSIFVGSEPSATRLKYVIARGAHLAEGAALRCSGVFNSPIATPVFGVNVSGVPVGNGMTLQRGATGWTCNPSMFGSGDGCHCDCGILDPDCPATACEECCTTGNLADCTNTGTGTRCQLGTLEGSVCTGSVAKSAEVCDNVDNDCNGVVDNVPGIGTPCTGGGTNTTGACETAYQCLAFPGPGPSGLTCVQTVGPTAEVCNGADDNCNGTTDDNPAGVGSPCCYTGTLSNCTTLGTLACVTGTPVCFGSSCECDGDPCTMDTCDAGGCVSTPIGQCGDCCVTGNLADCTNTGTGTRCQLGTLEGSVCTGSVAKSAEICDNVDNDCNGVVDNVPGIGTPCTGGGTNTTGTCEAAYQCFGSPGPGPGGLTCVQMVGPTAEVCNGADENCNGTTDDNPAGVGSPCCYTGTLSDCTTLGTLACVSGIPVCFGSI